MSNYIMDLRKVVGHAPLLQAAAGIIIENENGQVLLEKRTDNHQWGYAGGSIELGETVEEAAKENSLRRWDLLQTRWSCFISIQARRLTTSILTVMKSIMWKSYTYAANIMAP